MIEIAIKKPRRRRVFRPYLTQGQGGCGHCPGCLARMEEQVNNERPGHVFASENGKILYMEDVVMEAHLNRKLEPNETVIHRNANPKDNRLENLELVVIPDLGEK